MLKKIKFAPIIFAFLSAVIVFKIININLDNKIKQISQNYGRYVLGLSGTYPPILDRNFEKLNNINSVDYVLVNPNADNLPKIVPYVKNDDFYYENLQKNQPFLAVADEKLPEDEELPFDFFTTTVRNDNSQLAKHILGYRSNGAGICGLEKSFDEFFAENLTQNKAVYDVNAVGAVLEGISVDVTSATKQDHALVLTLDSEIQQICENALNLSQFEKGAVVVLDVKTSEILASYSKPDINLSDISVSLEDKNSPFINRVFSEYSVGSIFKLVTATAALESGISPEFTNYCDGATSVNGQVFNCHKWGGHKELSMKSAIVTSCNPYFISLAEFIDNDFFLETATNFGFSKATYFRDDLVSKSGNLPTASELLVPAEKANLSFGQGKLTATPLQICNLTATIANDGIFNSPTLIMGNIEDGNYVKSIQNMSSKQVISTETALLLQDFMIETVNSNSIAAKSIYFVSGGKTSTAQTGQFDENGREQYNCFFTGFFPAENPQYAVTILVENGTSGNRDAGPIYKQIAENIYLSNEINN